MDLIYIPEVFAYGSFRNPHFQDYEQPWNRNPFGYGRSTQYKRAQLQQEYQQRKAAVISKENCHLCRESKRRSLAMYIKNKSRRDFCHEIHEEEEDKEEEQEKKQIIHEIYDDTVTQKQDQQKHTTSSIQSHETKKG